MRCGSSSSPRPCKHTSPSVFVERLCLGAAGPANWEAVINGQCLFLTQVVVLHIKVTAFMEASLIELEGMRLIPPQPQDIRPKGSGSVSVPSSPSSLCPVFVIFFQEG